MVAISLWEPWAFLMVHGLKQIETRSWPLRHRGPLLIHAAQRWNGELAALTKAEPFASALRSLGVMWSDRGRPNIPFGAIVGRVDVVECYHTEQVKLANPNHFPGADTLVVSETEHAFGDYSGGRYAWLCANPVVFEAPIPYRGEQGIFRVDEALLKGAV